MRLYGSMEAYYAQSMQGWSSSQVGQRGVDFMAGMRVYDISTPAEPRQIGYLDIEGLGLHRIWYDGGRYAYASALLEGYTDHILLIIDMADPSASARSRTVVDTGHVARGWRDPVVDAAAGSRSTTRWSRMASPTARGVTAD